MRRLAAVRDSNTLGLWNHVQTAPVLGIVALVLDQLTKLLVRETLMTGESIPHDACVRITHVVNPGILFGAPASPLVSLLLPLAMILVALGLYWRFHRTESTLLNVGTGLFVGGTMGNLLDRIIYGHVTDFVEVVSSGGDVSTVFNLADLCIIVGIIILEAFLIRHIIRLIMQKGLRYNPMKPAVDRLIRRRHPRAKD
ncbi:MAG: signal peptidase II [Dehalococcoidia bacterium]|nr:signal peptidase II [Dehalococcoidia bacterium]